MLEGEAAAAPAADDGGAGGYQVDRGRHLGRARPAGRPARRACPRSLRRRRAPRRVHGRPRRVRVAVQDVDGRRRAEAPLLREDEVPPREDALRRRRPSIGAAATGTALPEDASSTGGATSSATSPLRGEKTRAGDWRYSREP